MTATVGPVTLTAPAWTAVYAGAGGAKNGVVTLAGGVTAVAVVAADEPAAEAGGLAVTPQGVAVAVGALETLWARAYGTTDNEAVAVVVFTPTA